MKEDFLQFIWKLQLFQPIQLRTIYNEKIKVLKPGFENHNEGPDFLNASVEIDGQLWSGHVEIHLKSSDWYVHLHQLDANYNATVLHVVWEYDVPVYLPEKVEVPTLEIQNFIGEKVLNQYKVLFDKDQKWIYCENLIGDVTAFKIDKWLEVLYFERLQKKVQVMHHYLKKSNNNWAEVLYWSLAKNFGLKVNGANFLEIVQTIPFTVFSRNVTSVLKLEALLFGQAGLLLESRISEAYYQKLQKEYEFLKTKYSLNSPLKRRVHFFRLRPVNFPTIRWSQFANLYHRNQSLFRSLMEANSVSEIFELFDVKASKYWDNHFTFKKNASKIQDKKVSERLIELIIINTVIPLKFMYFQEQSSNDFYNQYDLLERMKPEENQIITKFKALGVNAKNALQSQALLQLKLKYCDRGNCLKCALGKEILQP